MSKNNYPTEFSVLQDWKTRNLIFIMTVLGGLGITAGTIGWTDVFIFCELLFVLVLLVVFVIE